MSGTDDPGGEPPRPEPAAKPAGPARPAGGGPGRPGGPGGPGRPGGPGGPGGPGAGGGPGQDISHLPPAQQAAIRARRQAAAAAAAANAALAATTATSVETITKLRRKRLLGLSLRLGLGSLLPTLITAVYLGFVASPQYESTVSFTIESSHGGGSGGLEMLAGASLGAAMRDTILAREQIASRDMSDHLVERHGFVPHYQDRSRDVWFRLARGASREEIFDYYLDRVDAEFDWQTGVVKVRVSAFTRRDATRFANAILHESERRMNERMDRARRDTLAVAEREVARAARNLEEARRAVAAVRAQGGEIDPARAADATLQVRSQVELQLAAAQAELVALLQNMQPDAPQVVAARQRVNGLISAVSRQNQRLVSEGQNDMQARLETYEPAALQKEMAQQAYTASVESLELARRQLLEQHRYLVRVAGPTTPGESTYPDVFFGSVTVFLVSLCLVIIASLMVSSIREHANV